MFAISMKIMPRKNPAEAYYNVMIIAPMTCLALNRMKSMMVGRKIRIEQIMKQIESPYRFV